MEYKRRDYFITFTMLGLSAAALMAYQYAGALLFGLAETWAKSQETGVFRWFSWLFDSPWTAVLVKYLFVIGGAYPIIALLLCRIPKFKGKLQPLSLAAFLLCLIAAMGTGNVFNLLGNLVNAFFSAFNGRTIEEMNPAAEMMMDMTPSMVIYACFLGPFMEELLFRGMILKRARRFGDRTAVAFTAVLFGLMHGNLLQFFYAAAIGLILGYVAVRTSSIRYTVLMHMAINSFSTVMVAGQDLVAAALGDLAAVPYSMAFLAFLVFMTAGGAMVLWRFGPIWYRQVTAHNGEKSPWKKYVYWNPGFLLFLGLCLLEMIVYLF